MGLGLGKTKRSDSMSSVDVDGSNGLVLKGVYIPEEVLILILSNLDAKTLVKSRRVCKRWSEVLSGPVWHCKALREVPGLNHLHFRDHELSWKDLFWMCNKKPFERNLVKNPYGQDKMESWSETNGGDGWAIEQTSNGCDPFPKGVLSCFVTSYNLCTAEQVIDLNKQGLTETVMDEIRPEITVSEWYAARWDCGAEYKIKVSLLNSNCDVVCSFTRTKIMQNNRVQWRQVKHTFWHYDKGVRFILFYHSGRDLQYWAGHYGAKMAGASVTVSLPNRRPSQSGDSSPNNHIHDANNENGVHTENVVCAKVKLRTSQGPRVYLMRGTLSSEGQSSSETEE